MNMSTLCGFVGGNAGNLSSGTRVFQERIAIIPDVEIKELLYIVYVLFFLVLYLSGLFLGE